MTVQDEQSTFDRRQTNFESEKLERRSVWNRASLFLFGFQISDVFSANHHSEDFNDTRAHYIIVRARLMAYVFAVCVPLWAFIDYFTITAQHFWPMVTARLALAAGLAYLGWYSHKRLTIRRLNIILPLLFALPIAFYVVSIVILQSGVAEVPLVGYRFLPFLTVIMMGLFPLTLTYSIYIILIILLPTLALEYWFGNLFSADTLNKLWAFVMFTGVSVWLQIGQLLMLLKLYREATLDPLTLLINRKVLVKKLALEKERNQEHGEIFSVMMFDLDKFKRINDNYGHLTGDQVLKSTAQILTSKLRGDDIVARFGGEEFVAVLHGKGAGQAMALAERIREICAETFITTKSGVELRVTTSVGVSEYESGESIETLLARADDALYQAKSDGRDRVVHKQSKSYTLQ